MKKPKWICVDEHFCTEFGESANDCIERYRESMGQCDPLSLTFYELTEPYVVEVLYTLKRKKTY